jgi:hypothetical protein
MSMATSCRTDSASNGAPDRSVARTSRMIDATAALVAVAGVGVSAYLLNVATASIGRWHSGPWQETRFGWWLDLPVFAVFLALFVVAAAAVSVVWLAPAGRARTWARAAVVAVAAALGALGLWHLVVMASGSIIVGHWSFLMIALMLLFAWTALFVSWPQAASHRHAAVALGLLTALVVPAVQWAAPSTDAIERAHNPYDYMHRSARFILPADSTSALSVERMPLLGSPDAPYIVISFFDYASDASRATQRAVVALQRRFGSQVAVMPVLYPLDPDCNPKVTADMLDPDPHSCAYARLSLAVWLADGDAFSRFHESLIDQRRRDDMPTPDAARAYATELVGNETLARALADPRIDQLLAHAIAAKPPSLSSGLRSESEAGGIVDLEPVTMWRGKAADDPVMVGIGRMEPDGLLRQFEQITGVVPVSGAPGRTGDPAAGGLTELLESIAP